MRIAMINTALMKGGAARAALSLAKAIMATGNTVNFYHCENRREDKEYIGLARPGSRYLNIILSRFFGSYSVYDFGVSHELISRTRNSDVIHLHNLHGYYLNYADLLENLNQIPIVWTWHDMWGATGRCAFSTDCTRWKTTNCSSCPHLDYYPRAWFDNAHAEYKVKQKIFDGLKNLVLVTPSVWLKEIALSRGFKESQVKVIPNAVDLKSYIATDKAVARGSLRLNVNKPFLLFVAADCSDMRKGYNDFLSIVETLGINGIVIGKPPKKKSPLIFYTGLVRDASILSLYYSAAEVLIIPSIADNYPNTVIEAMACGTPVFGYNVGGIPDQMPPNWEGIVGVGDVKELTLKISMFLMDGGKTTELQSSMRDYATTTWSPSIIAEKYLDLYKRTALN